jgi:hypothetical protein
VVTSVRVTVSGMRAAICWTWPAVAKGPRLPWAGAQAESSGRVEEHEVLADGLAQQPRHRMGEPVNFDHGRGTSGWA